MAARHEHGGKHGSTYYYPYYRSLQGLPAGLEGLDPNAWAALWVDLSGVEGQIASHQVWTILIILFFGIFTHFGFKNFAQGARMGVAATFFGLAFLCALVAVHVNSHASHEQRWRIEDVLSQHEQGFRATGFALSYRIEPSGRGQVGLIVFIPIRNTVVAGGERGGHDDRGTGSVV